MKGEFATVVEQQVKATCAEGWCKDDARSAVEGCVSKIVDVGELVELDDDGVRARLKELHGQVFYCAMLEIHARAKKRAAGV